jgi:hypothetical protein
VLPGGSASRGSPKEGGVKEKGQIYQGRFDISSIR